MPILAPITAVQLQAALERGDQLRLVDVREPSEWVSELGHIAGAELVPLGQVTAALPGMVADRREVILICKSGARAGRAAQLFASAGFEVSVLTGGMLAWNSAGLATTRTP